MNIYDEAIKEVKMFFNDEDWVHKSIMPKTIKALEHAKKEHTELEALKRYPTSDEVCEALNEYFGDDYKVNVSTSNQIFVEHKDDRDGDVCIEYDGELIYFDNFSLPPHLITLIGRFYEGLEKGEGK